MLVSLLGFMWGANTPVQPPIAPLSALASAKSGSHGNEKEYSLLSDEYWEERDKRLKGEVPPVKEPVPDTTAEDFIKNERDRQYAEFMSEVNQLIKERDDLATFQQMHQQALSSLRSSKNTDEMEQIDATIQKIEDAATALERQHKSRLARANTMRKELAIN